MKNLWVCLGLLALGACGEASTQTNQTTPTSGGPAIAATSGLPIERYFPIIDNHLWTYDSLSDDSAPSSFLVRARRVRADEGELQTPRGPKRFSFMPEGIGLVDKAAFVLKLPLVEGTTWRGEHGGIARIATVGATVAVTAGRFTDCIVTIEERGGDIRATYTTTFCPDVGIVVLDVEGGMQHERAELRSYGPPVSIGPSGTTLIKP